ncbi:hypothetical protein [Ramlibacter tataouinensis]|uniref:Uncharacterized protein n=1 Tax=Ramlibacter tataouinensis (strain ATCC BAA-407 / DSM 14655 / LMG 21543 / TTB310) TaxID=365046 RepID=F5XY44_RAMTT|nr:hypothetical protein [Ramlibacter tataouinensis]AEG94369.1 conserved hypothetical protein [Ramlibacter tataouinensis TTB310]
MRATWQYAGRWLGAGIVAAAIAACGGGGGGGGGGTATPEPTPAATPEPLPVATPEPTPDARNGDYTAFGTDGYLYTLSLDFDAMTYAVSGNATNATGTIVADGSGYLFQPAPSGAARNTARFTIADDSVVGGFPSGAGVGTFIASRNFITTVAEAVGTYNFLARIIEPSVAPNTSIFSGEITSAGTLRYCQDNAVYAIAQCPAASVQTATLTVSGDEFIGATATGNMRFRVARIGSDKVFLRVTISPGTSRRFWVGTPETAAYAAGTFTGVNTLGTAGTFTVSSTAHSASGVTPSGTTVTREGTVNSLGGIGPTSMVGIQTADQGNFFSIRSTHIGVVAAARGNTFVPGLFEIGRAQ